MNNELIHGADPLPEDHQILAALESEAYGLAASGGQVMMVGIRNEAGVLYRRISTEGLGQFLAVIEALRGLGLVDELEDATGLREGCDAIFARPGQP